VRQLAEMIFENAWLLRFISTGAAFFVTLQKCPTKTDETVERL